MVLVLCVDRDNDIGEKTKYKGPIIGEKNNIKVANALLLADPEDNDANTIFAAVKIARETKNAKIATVTGDKKVGIKSDEIIAKQLKKVIQQTKERKVILVTDGLEDERIIPIIQDKLSIVSVHRVVMKQSERLEGMYYMVKDFVKNITEDPHFAKVFLGVPALVLLLVAIFDITGWRIVLGVLGLYLLIKGFKIEETVNSVIKEFTTSLKKNKLSFFLYAVSVVFLLIAIAFGHHSAKLMGNDVISYGTTFIYGSAHLILVAGFIFWVGKLIIIRKQKGAVLRYLTLLALFFAIVIVARSASELMIKPEIDFSNLILSIIIGFGTLTITLILERVYRK